MSERTDRRGSGEFRRCPGNPLNQQWINLLLLPARPIKVGDSWTEPYTDTNQPSGFFSRFAPKKGTLLEYIQDDFYEGTTALSGRPMPNSNESKLTLKLLEWKPKK